MTECKYCGEETLNISSATCDYCWEVDTRIDNFVSSEAGRDRILVAIMRASKRREEILASIGRQECKA